MAQEVIDLISDSEDEASTQKAATSTLQAFGPRKEKNSSGHARSTFQNHEVIQTPHAHPPTNDARLYNTLPPTATGAFRHPPQNESISDILRQNAQNASGMNSLLGTQHQRYTSPNAFDNYVNARAFPAPLDSYRVSTNRVQQPGRQNTDIVGNAQRVRKFVRYYQKETARKGGSRPTPGHGSTADTKDGPPAANTVWDSRKPLAPATAASSSSKATAVGPTVPPKRKPSSPVPNATQPVAKRSKDTGYKDTEIFEGMRQARRVPAAAVSPIPDPAAVQPPLQDTFIASEQVVYAPTRVTERNVVAPLGGLSSTSMLNGASKGVRQSRESLDLTTEPYQAPFEFQQTASRSSAIRKSIEAKQKLDMSTKAAAQKHPPSSRESSEDCPDVIPAKVPTKQPSLASVYTEKPTPTSSIPIPTHEDTPAPLAPKEPVYQESRPAVPAATNTSTPKVCEPQSSNPGGGFGTRYSAEEDQRLIMLKEQNGITWDQMPRYFSGRTRGSLQVRYSGLKNRKPVASKARYRDSPDDQVSSRATTSEVPNHTMRARRQARTASRNDGFVSWADIKAKKWDGEASEDDCYVPVAQKAGPVQSPANTPDVIHPSSIRRLLRCRELGSHGGRAWSSSARMTISDELKNHVFDSIGPRRYFHGASRDVTCVAWAEDGNRFAAGAIAIDDDRSMQYNRPNNLLLGNVDKNSLQELPEHHVQRPAVTDPRNVNSLHAMQETQDPRLFKTVAALGFSEDGNTLYTGGSDGVVRMYDSSNGRLLHSHWQNAEVALLTTNTNSLLAAGCHLSNDSSISVLRCSDDRFSAVCDIGPGRADVQSSLPIFPSALKWGSGSYGHLLLAGFASDSFEEDRVTAGEVCLWDSTAEKKMPLPTARNVFDVAWNPSPSSGSTLFAVAGTNANKRIRSTIQCFAPNQGRASRVLQWDCPAFDINDVLYCPHDDNLIAAGATDGKVYLWDKRYANRNQSPLHVFSHGQTKNVVDHDRDLELADTGVRFLSWSATSNRLYSGSSDGTLKIWNPYRTTEDALVKDVATFNSAIMSGAFSPDYRDLLIGEDQGQLNLLGIDREGRSVRAAKKFDLYPAPVPQKTEDKLATARELVKTGQIELKPMGVLPVKQAVQGPRYSGPFMNPPDGYIAQLERQKQIDLADLVQINSMLHLTDNSDHQNAKKAAEARVEVVEGALQKARKNQAEYQPLEAKASVQQKQFCDARHAWKKNMLANATQRCRLDCNYLPPAGDDDGEAPDDRRSEQRIPERLRAHHQPLDVADMTNAEIAEAGLTSKCSACTGPAAPSKRGLSVCERCALVPAGLTARCEKCAAPIRPNLDGDERQRGVCERCDFRCFRCGQAAVVSSQGREITCKSCGVHWEAGVLGYEVKRISEASTKRARDVGDREMMESLEDRMSRLLGEDEIERLAGGWKVALVDGPPAL